MKNIYMNTKLSLINSYFNRHVQTEGYLNRLNLIERAVIMMTTAEQIPFQLILNSGNARSFAMEALQFAKQGKWQKQMKRW